IALLQILHAAGGNLPAAGGAKYQQCGWTSINRARSAMNLNRPAGSVAPQHQVEITRWRAEQLRVNAVLAAKRVRRPFVDEVVMDSGRKLQPHAIAVQQGDHSIDTGEARKWP